MTESTHDQEAPSSPEGLPDLTWGEAFGHAVACRLVYPVSRSGAAKLAAAHVVVLAVGAAVAFGIFYFMIP